MYDITYSLQISAPETSKEINIPVQHSPDIHPIVNTSAGAIQVEHFTALTLVPILKKEVGIPGWRVNSTLLIQLERTQKQSLATMWLEGVAEYGAGEDDNEAIMDLITSLAEYRECLEEREQNLGDSSRKELACLRNLIERDASNLSNR